MPQPVEDFTDQYHAGTVLDADRRTKDSVQPFRQMKNFRGQARMSVPQPAMGSIPSMLESGPGPVCMTGIARLPTMPGPACHSACSQRYPQLSTIPGKWTACADLCQHYRHCQIRFAPQTRVCMLSSTHVQLHPGCMIFCTAHSAKPARRTLLSGAPRATCLVMCASGAKSYCHLLSVGAQHPCRDCQLAGGAAKGVAGAPAGHKILRCFKRVACQAGRVSTLNGARPTVPGEHYHACSTVPCVAR